MLLEFTCSNHKSIRDKITFTAIANADTSHEESLATFDKQKVIKAAVIYGANGSGKTNFIDSIRFVQELVLNSVTYKPAAGIRCTPFKTDGVEKDSIYTIQFTVDSVRYAYGFSLQNNTVAEEYLYYFPNGRKTCIFERSKDEVGKNDDGMNDGVSEGAQFRGKFSSVRNDVLKPNNLMLSCAHIFSKVPEVEAAYRFFAQDLIIYDSSNPPLIQFDQDKYIFNPNNFMDYSLQQIYHNPSMKNIVVAIMQSLGIAVKDIEISVIDSNIPLASVPSFLSDAQKQDLIKNGNTIQANLVYENFKTDLFSEESDGIKKLISMLCPLIDMIWKGKVFICDEFESSFHESLIYGLIKEFYTMSSNRNQSPQIIFTTHATELLDLDLFRRDQIWFTEMRPKDRSTDLYCLSQLGEVRKNRKYRKGYISGKYGAIPMLNLEFAELISMMQED